MNALACRSLGAAAVTLAVLLFTAEDSVAAAEIRTWTDAQGKALTAEYLSSAPDSVMVRRADGQAMRLKLSDLSEADRTFVAQKQTAEKEANMIDAVLKGEIIWRLPTWSSLSWSTTQPAEISFWDDKTRQITEKIATVKVTYETNQRNRNQFEGTFSTEKPVHIPKNARVIVKSEFNVSVNGKSRKLEELSVPMSLPALSKGEIKLPAVRLTITR